MDFNKPLSRDEAILQNILGAQNVLSDPQSEIEAILQAILNDTPYTEEGRSRIASLLIAIKNKGVPLPELDTLNVTENGTYTAEEGHAYNEVNVDVPLPDNAYLLKDIANTPASIATFTDGSALPMPKLEVAIEPQQDLHGYDAPWIGGAGKNKLQVTATAQTINGVTFTVNSDGTVNLSGTATGTFVFPLISGTLSFSSDTIITGGYAEASASKVALRINESNLVPSEGYTISANTNITEIAIRVNSGFNTNGVKLYPMIRLSSVTDSTFAPYSNICPISGWDEVDVTRAGKNLFDIHIDKDTAYTNIILDKLLDQTFTVSAVNNNVAVSEIVWRIGFVYKNNEMYYVGDNGYQRPFPQTIIATESNPIVKIQYRGTAMTSGSYDVQVELGSQPTTYEAYNGQTYNIQFKDGSNPLTVYSGSLDVTSGELVVDRVSVTYDGSNDENWGSYSSNYQGYPITIRNGNVDAINPSTQIKSNYLKVSQSRGPSGDDAMIKTYTATSDNNVIFVCGLGITEKSEFLTYLSNNNLQVIYPLATPQTYQLNPTLVKSLLNTNNVWADTGKIEELEYFSKE